LEETHKGKEPKNKASKNKANPKTWPPTPSFYQVARRCQKWAPNYFSIKKKY
jgi:hypothetical protein